MYGNAVQRGFCYVIISLTIKCYSVCHLLASEWSSWKLWTASQTHIASSMRRWVWLNSSAQGELQPCASSQSCSSLRKLSPDWMLDIVIAWILSVIQYVKRPKTIMKNKKGTNEVRACISNLKPCSSTSEKVKCKGLPPYHPNWEISPRMETVYELGLTSVIWRK